MRAQQFQYEARMMAEATKRMEDAASQIKMQPKEEQRQLREADSALTEANKVLRRENLLGTSAVDDGRERIVLEEKCQEIEENRKIAKKKLLEARSENAKLKAETQVKNKTNMDCTFLRSMGK